MTSTTGIVWVVSAPSGAGKTSLLRALLPTDPRLRVSVSHTTRAPRPGEEDGVHYHFVDPATFESMVVEGAFLEHAQVFENFYGTAEQSVRAGLEQGHDVVLEIDWQGARQVRRRFPEAVSIFIVPPGIAALRQRLSGRGQDSPEVIERRMQAARSEMSHFDEYDYLVVNDVFGDALGGLQAIVRAERLRLSRQRLRLNGVLRDMLAG
jgi:guanylate kinase